MVCGPSERYQVSKTLSLPSSPLQPHGARRAPRVDWAAEAGLVCLDRQPGGTWESMSLLFPKHQYDEALLVLKG